jgi:hypothetical protein
VSARRLSHLGVLAAVLVLAFAPSARADDFQQIFGDYRADGVVSPCSHSETSLHNAQGQIPNDIEQYAPDFPAALQSALEARARGQCGGAAAAPAPAIPAPPAGALAPRSSRRHRHDAAAPPPAPPAAEAPAGASAAASDGAAAAQVPGVNAATRSEAPLPVVLLGAVGGAFALALLAWALGRRALPAGGPARHAFAETGYRAGGLWADFRDWLRTGR